MAQSARRISRAVNSALVPTFIPALLLSLVLGTALGFKLLHLATPIDSASVEHRGGVADLANHHADPNGADIVVPGEWMGGSQGSHHMASARPVAEQLAARADDVEFCVGATLEPFDAAWAQLQAIGPGEATERTRRCLMELVFTHVDPATAANVRGQIPAFSGCYQRAIDLPAPSKAQAMAEITDCLTSLE